MRRISQAYVYVRARAAACEICHRRVLPGMFCFSVRLGSDREGIAHSLCEPELKKLSEERS